MDQKIGNIQALRALAALAVLGAHLWSFDVDRTAAQTLPSFFAYGFSGVDLFFVISGFVMALTTRGRFGSPRNAGMFLFSRAWRIYPPYWLFSVIAVAAFAGAGILDERLTSTSLWRSFALWPQMATNLPILAVGWTLVHEIYFYIVFALFLLAPQRVLPLLALAWACVVLLAWRFGVQYASPAASLVFSPLTFEFIAGVLAGLLLISGRRRLGWAALALGVASLVAGSIWLGPPEANSFGSAARRAAAFAVPYALIVYGVASIEIRHGVRAPAAAVALGDWSYSLYLLHFLIVGAAFRIWADRVAGPWDDIALAVFISATSIALAGLSYRWFERPVLALGAELRARIFGPSRRRDAAAATPRKASRIW